MKGREGKIHMLTAVLSGSGCLTIAHPIKAFHIRWSPPNQYASFSEAPGSSRISTSLCWGSKLAGCSREGFGAFPGGGVSHSALRRSQYSGPHWVGSKAGGDGMRG
jgi:hypothetical protein